ncbi:MAG: aldo/keto reductase [Candidatus Sericytochromatia bacterium]
MTKQEFYTTSQNIKMPKIIYGTAWKKDKTDELVFKAVELGFRGIDTACQPKHYNEPLVGKALEKLSKIGIKRESLFLQTKFTSINGQDPNNIPYDKNADLETQVKQSFESSKKNLITDYIDSLVLHSPMSSHFLNMKVWGVLEKYHEKGEIKQLGISNCYDLKVLKDLYKDSNVKPSIIQNRFYNQTDYDKDIRNFCNQNNIIYQSFWTLTANPHILQSQVILEISKKINKTPAQILFIFLTQIGIAPLTGTCNEKHMQEDLSIFDFKLSQEDINKINSLF